MLVTCLVADHEVKLGKFWQESPQPKFLRPYACLAQSLGFAESHDPLLSESRLLLHTAELCIGGDFDFESTPELVHSVEFRPLLWQPNDSTKNFTHRSRLEPGHASPDASDF